jgi:hypothetical protein
MNNEVSWPRKVTDFENFLKTRGLVCQRREEEPYFSNKVLQYGDATVRVRVVSDRGIWFVEVDSPDPVSNEWYDTALLRDLLIGLGKDELTLEEQVDFIQVNWLSIVNLFALAAREQTASRLASLRQERVRRRLPGLFSRVS